MGVDMNDETRVVRRELGVRGIVQGVGFRPFVHQLAVAHGLAGFIRNSDEGVDIAVEGTARAVDSFQRELTTLAPPLARLERILVRVLQGAPLASRWSQARPTIANAPPWPTSTCARRAPASTATLTTAVTTRSPSPAPRAVPRCNFKRAAAEAKTDRARRRGTMR